MSLILSRRSVSMAGLAAVLAGCEKPVAAPEIATPPQQPPPPPAKPAPQFEIIRATAVPGGYILGKAGPGLEVQIDGSRLTLDAEGYFFAGLDRNRVTSAVITAYEGGPEVAREEVQVAARTYKSEEIEVPRAGGLPVSPEWYDLLDPGLLRDFESDSQSARQAGVASGRRSRADELALKNKAFASRSDAVGFREAWVAPVKGRVSSEWGSERVLVKPDGSRSPQIHWGNDIAAISGTPVLAPASGLVALAEPDMSLEGGCVFLDHGLGLVSVYLHMSEVLVEAGQIVKQSDQIGSVGSKGRATGPHLCWRLRLGDTNLDASAMIGGAAALAK